MAQIRILVVEDDQEIAQLMTSCLQRKIDCEILQVSNGDDAFKQITEQSFDLVLLDINIPGISGLDLINKLKSESHLPDTLIVTGMDSQDICDEVIRDGSLDYIPKPVAPQVLIQKVIILLQKKGITIEEK